MTQLLTAAQMRTIEQAAIASGEVTGLELMERAGQGVVAAIFAEWPALKAVAHRAAVLCGPGNNGGDGFVVARLLKECGWEVEVFLYGDPEKLPPDARVNYERWQRMGAVAQLVPGHGSPFLRADILVDALFGTGLSRPLEGFAPLFDAIYEAQNNILRGPHSPWVEAVVAVDILSGTCADSGRFLADEDYAPVCADLTVTFHERKVGHVMSEAWAEKVVVADIGLTKGRLHRISQDAVGWLDIVKEVDRPTSPRLAKGDGHKYTHGHALILSGGAGRGGAARLAARGALRIGAGVVTVGCPPDALTENAARLDAVMLKPVADADAFGRILEDQRINALCLGPGLGSGEREAGLIAAALEQRGDPRPVVLDADALRPGFFDEADALFGRLHDRCVLTPHAGEFARLFPDIAAKLEAPATTGPAYSRVDATREAAKRAGCVVVFKGPDTVIADPAGRCAINAARHARAAPWLATAGSGDVLAGFVCGLMARGYSPFDAACTGAWLHLECARSFGPGLIAEDLPEQLPQVLRALGC